ncbi:MAG: T9SS type A sorting domain-containing protein [Saprospiraceae bacterium]|nr:T9SS type A sorting domain-containing protein [Lewinella sp.]
MKQPPLSFLFLLVGIFQINAQVSLDPVQIVVPEVSPDSTQVVGYGRVKNEADETRTYRWIRTIRSLSDGWETAVCDTNLCYLPFVDSMEFELSAQLEANLNVYVYPNGVAGSAVVDVRVVDVNNPEYSATASYYFNEQPSRTRQKQRLQQVRVYPNPTPGIFRLSDHEQIRQVVIFNLVGRPVHSFTYSPGDSYDISKLPKGTYMVQLQDKQGQILVTKMINKQ